jgi:ligand-binding sensor domain-containing protein
VTAQGLWIIKHMVNMINQTWVFNHLPYSQWKKCDQDSLGRLFEEDSEGFIRLNTESAYRSLQTKQGLQ